MALHTDTSTQRHAITNVAQMILGPENRARRVKLEHSFLAPPMWIGGNAGLTPLNGKLVSRFQGRAFVVGPNQPLYIVTIGPFIVPLHMEVEDQIEEGDYTDAGSRDAVDEPGGGDTPPEARPSPSPASRPGARKD